MTEYSIMSLNLSRWLVVNGEGVLTLSSNHPFSMMDAFPDEPDAGRQDFAVRLLKAMVSGNLPKDLTMNIPAHHLADLAVFSFTNKRSMPDMRDLDFAEKDCANFCVDVQGPDVAVDRWVGTYMARFSGRRFTSSAIDIDQSSGMKTTRIWRRRTEPLPELSA